MASNTKGGANGSLGGEGLQGIPEPIVTKGEQQQYTEWDAKHLVHMHAVVSSESHGLVAWAESQDKAITDEDLDSVVSETDSVR